MANLERLFELTKLCDQYNARLVAVSKTQPVSQILEVYNTGHKIFGENRVQELCEKQEILPADIEWHMIGHLQTNKVKYIASFVSMIHSVDSLKLAVEVSKQALKHNRIIPVLLQFHIAEEETKFGFDEEMVRNDLNELINLKGIAISGVMGMATFTEDITIVRREFRYLKEIFIRLQQSSFNYPEFNTISMGMSGDYQVALEEGSTLIRVGSAIFGERN